MNPAKGIRSEWLAATAIALVIAGCGGGTTGGSTARSAATSPAVVRADAICAQLNTQLISDLPKSVSTKEIAAISPRNAALEQRAARELASLRPPASIEREWQELISDRRLLAEALTSLGQAARAGEQASVETLGKYKAHLRAQLLEVGERIGFTSCQKLG